MPSLNDMLKKVDKHYPVLWVLAFLGLGLMALGAYNQAVQACTDRWKVTKLKTDYTKAGCVVEVEPDRWVREDDVDSEITLRLKEKQ